MAIRRTYHRKPIRRQHHIFQKKKNIIAISFVRSIESQQHSMNMIIWLLHKTLTIPSISFVSLIFSYHISCLISCINYFTRRKLDWPIASTEIGEKNQHSTQHGWEDMLLLFLQPKWRRRRKKKKIGRLLAKTIDTTHLSLWKQAHAFARFPANRHTDKNDDQIQNLLKYEFKIYVDTRTHWNFKWDNLTATFLAIHFKRFFFNCLCCSDL